MNSDKVSPQTALELAAHTFIRPDILLAAYGDLSTTSEQIYMMLPHWNEAHIIFDQAQLVDSQGRYIATQLTAEQVLLQANYSHPNRRFTLPTLRALCEFEHSVLQLVDKAGRAVDATALRAAALPKLTWTTTEAVPVHPAIVIAALSKIGHSPTNS